MKIIKLNYYLVLDNNLIYFGVYSMNKENPFFSIIMPVYNTEKYLDKAIKSVLNQTFKSFEFILIDDWSIDKSYKICKKYADNDSRIKLLKNDINLGVAKTRNKALNSISGKYLTFVDSDDYIENNLLKKAYKLLMNEKIDLLKYSCKEEYVNEDEQVIYSKICQVENSFFKDKIEIQNQIINMEKIPLFGYLWNSFYKIDIIKKNKIMFNENYTVNEDFAFNIDYVWYIKNLYCINFLGYHYMKRENNSLSTKKQDNYYILHMMKINLLLEMCNKFNNLTQENKEIIYWMYVRYIYSAIERNIDNEKNIEILVDKIKKDYLYKKFLSIKFKKINVKQKIMISFLKMKRYQILVEFIRVISWIKKNFPIFFAKIKK